MILIWDITEDHILFLPKNGSSSFWWDNWLGDGRLAQRAYVNGNHKVSDFVLHDRWNMPLLQQWIPRELLLQVQRLHPPIKGDLDIMV